MIALAYDPHQLVTENLGLAYHMVEKIIRWHTAVQRMGFDDALGYANIALVKASQRWQPERGKFTTFAGCVIQHEVIDAATSRANSLLCDGIQDVAAPAVHDPVELQDQRELMLLALEMLSDQNRDVIRAHHGIGKPAETFQEIGKRWGVTKQAACGQYHRAMKSLRATIARLAATSLE